MTHIYKRFTRTALFGCMAVIPLFHSCADEDSSDKPFMGTSEQIIFTLPEEEQETRATKEDSTSNNTPDSTLYKAVMLGKDGDSLFVRATVSDDFPAVDKVNDGENTTMETRGAIVSSVTSFGASASIYASNQSYTANPCGNFFYKQNFTPNTPTGYFWPTSAYRLSFYAYYPYGNSAFTVSSSASSNGIPTYAYTVPSSISAQQDVMTAQVTNKACGSPQTPVSLSFNHHTSAIKVKYTNDGASPVTITRGRSDLLSTPVPVIRSHCHSRRMSLLVRPLT